MTKLKILTLITATVIILFIIIPAPVLGADLGLTAEEEAFLRELGEITMCVDPDWPPYEVVDEDGNFTGIAADLIDLVSERLGIPFVIIPTTDWAETLECSRAGNCHLIPFLNQTAAREEWLIFTEPLFIDPNVFVTREDHPYISDPSELVDKTIVLPEGTSIEEWVRRDYPNLEVVTTPDEIEAFHMVHNGQADMTLRSLMIAAYTIRKEGLFRLKISGEVPEYKNNLRMGVLKDEVMLRDILSKAIMTITPQEREEIINRHVSITMESPVNYTLIVGTFASMAFLALSLFSLLLYRQGRTLEQKVALRTQDLANSEELFRVLTQNTSAGIYIMQNGRFTQVNPAMAVITGYSEEELKEIDILDLTHPDYREMIHDRAEARLRGDHVPVRYEFKIIRKDGEQRWIEISAAVMSMNDTSSIIGTTYDITERKILEETIKGKADFQELIAAISSGFVNANSSNIDRKIDSMLERTGRFLSVDRTFLFQFSPDEKTMSNTHEWCAEGITPVKDDIQDYPVEDVPWIADIAKNRQMLFVPAVEDLPESPDKEELIRQQINSVLALPLTRGNILLGYFGFDAVRAHREIGEEEIKLLSIIANILADALANNHFEAGLLKARKQADEASQAKSSFLANMSHEIRTPLNAVIGFSGLMFKTELTSKQKDYMSKVQAASKILLGTINDILDFSKIEAGQLTTESGAISISQLVGNVVGLFSESAEAKGLTLSVEIDENIPAVLLGDQLRIEQVLINLIGNALKFTERGSITVTANLQEKSDPEKVEVVFAIKDSGIGIDPENCKRLFSPFMQADESITRNYGGTGLGLPISKSLVEMMGGQIDLISEPGQGSTFYFWLPFEVGSKDLTAEVYTDYSVLNGAQVLLVEDSQLNRELIVELLKEHHVQVDLATNGLEAIEILEAVAAKDNNYYDAVLMDLQMPYMDGFKLTEKIRGIDHFKTLPIIALTAHSTAEDREKCLEAGMNDYLSKPVVPEKLYATIARWLSGSDPTVYSGLHPDKRAPLDDQNVTSVSLPVEMERAIELMGGNRELYIKVAQAFIHEFKSSAETLDEAATKGDIKLIKKQVHNLKGSAGTVGAFQLQNRAAFLEGQTTEEGFYRKQVKELGTLLIETMDYLRSLMHDYEQENIFSITNEVPDDGLLLKHFEGLNKSLSERSFNSLEHFAAFRKFAESVIGPELLNELESAIQRFSFAESEAIMLRIRKEISASEERRA